MKTLLLVPDGVSIRNFLLTDLPDRLAPHGEVAALYGRARPTEGLAPSVARHLLLLDYPERPAEALLRRSLEQAHIRCWMTLAMRFNLEHLPRRGPRHRLMMAAADGLGRACATPSRVRLLSRAHELVAGRRPEVARYQALLEDLRPDVVLCAHHRPLTIIPAVLAARRLGIPTATFIFSWDNITTKGRIAVPFDHYFVWSEHMAQEMAHLYPDIDQARVHVVGTPQFEPYADASLMVARDKFLADLGADPHRPLICYSGGDRVTCPEDPQHLRLLLEAIAAGRIAGDPQVVVRPAPVDDGARYGSLRDDHPELLWAQPDWSIEQGAGWSAVTPTAGDVAFLANLTSHADVNVNMASTMSLDFAIHDVPVVNLGFDAGDPPPFGAPIDELYYRFDHYRPVVELGAVRLARSVDDLVDAINAYLRDPTLDGDGRRRLVELEVGVPPGAATSALCDALVRIARRA